MKTSDFYYKLPSEFIAQQPLPERTQSRMMVVSRETGSVEHRRVFDLPELVRPGDLIVVNDTRVFPARIWGCKEDTGGKVEILLIEETGDNIWDALVRASRPARIGAWLSLASGRIRAEVISSQGDGRVTLQLFHEHPVMDILEEEGMTPLPPYIKRPRHACKEDSSGQKSFDKNRYQTVYARTAGAIAAPTAGLHLTVELMNQLKKQGARITAITLHVGPGTFRPVKTENVEQHRMEPEKYSVSSETAGMIRETLSRKGRIIAVGSTVVRTLETVVSEYGSVVPAQGRTAMFIVPPYKFQVVNIMLTNFHLPESTLLMMVSAFAGSDLWRRAYQAAIEKRYRFYSYGDCMLII